MPRARVRACLLFLFVFVSSALGQQSGSARPVSDPKSAAGQDQSLADVARKLRDKKPVEVKMSGEDAKELFRSVDTIFTFAAEDTGFPRHSTVKRQLVGQADVEKFTRERLAKAESTQRFSRTELTMKKFGFLPRDFNMSEFLVKSNAQRIAGYYDEEKKSISLLNWVPLERQRPILAHELTHALQDQNYDLKKWIKAGQPASQSADKKEGASELEDGESTIARRAVVEGQAMVVYVDYLLSAFGRNMQNTPGVLSWIEDPAVTAVIDSELLHDAPMVLRETGTFPYREGLIFEGELLEKGGKRMAFAGALTATFVVYRLARGRAGATPERLILAGIIVTTFLSSAIVFLTTLMDATRIRSFTFWLLGDLSGATTSLLALTFVVALAGVALLAAHARPLNLMMLGERDAFDLGVETSGVRITVFVAASLLVGASVASSGSVGYVGLVVPHLVRLSFGGDNRLVIIAAALAGAAFVIVADTIARTIIAPRELPVGAITALIGAPLFIYLLRRGSS